MLQTVIKSSSIDVGEFGVEYSRYSSQPYSFVTFHVFAFLMFFFKFQLQSSQQQQFLLGPAKEIYM